MALHCAQNIISTYIPKTKTIQPNYLNLNHIWAPNLKKKRKRKRKLPVGVSVSFILVIYSEIVHFI